MPPTTPGTPKRSTKLLQPPPVGPATTTSPSPSPRRKKKVVYDRFIPNRMGVDLHAAFSLAEPPTTKEEPPTALEHRREAEANNNFNTVLRNELFGDIPSTPERNLVFTYHSPNKTRPSRLDLQAQLYGLLPVRAESQRFLLETRPQPRRVSNVPVCCLDAPELADDFYLNLVDWGLRDTLAVGLRALVYLWNALSGSVSTLCDLEEPITSLAWVGAGTHLAVGTQSGTVEIWDATAGKCTRTMTGHTARAASLSWNAHVLTSGSRDRSILHRDVRVREHHVARALYHQQEVCGLKWNVEENKLALGSNDNRVAVWDGLATTPLLELTAHTAAVKALAWSPHQRGILATGGGTADRSIKIWNTATGAKTHDVDTGSQVCNMLWLVNSNELVLSHGFLQHQIAVWKYPSMEQVASLTGHLFRVLHLAMSPDGQTIVSGAGDETLRFWRVFERSRREGALDGLLLR